MQIIESQSPRAENHLPDSTQMIRFQSLPQHREHREVISSEAVNSSNDEDSYSLHRNKSDLAKCPLIIPSASLWKTLSFLPIH